MLHKYNQKKFSQKAEFNVESRYRYDPRRPLQCKSFLGNRITILFLLFGILPSLSSLLYHEDQALLASSSAATLSPLMIDIAFSRVYEHSRYDAFLNYTAQSTIEFKKAFSPLSLWLLGDCREFGQK